MVLCLSVWHSVCLVLCLSVCVCHGKTHRQLETRLSTLRRLRIRNVCVVCVCACEHVCVSVCACVCRGVDGRRSWAYRRKYRSKPDPTIRRIRAKKNTGKSIKVRHKKATSETKGTITTRLDTLRHQHRQRLPDRKAHTHTQDRGKV